MHEFSFDIVLLEVAAAPKNSTATPQSTLGERRNN